MLLLGSGVYFSHQHFVNTIKPDPELKAEVQVESIMLEKEPTIEEEIEIAENFLRMSGASKIVRTSSYDHEGIQELIDLIENIDLTDY